MISKTMKKLISIFLTLTVFVSALSGCSGSNENKKLSVVTTIFPEYDWVMQILGNDSENINVSLLLDNGVDLHSFQPSADDIIKISSADLFIYVGGTSDDWIQDALKEAKNKNMITINLFEVLEDRVKEEELVEGMEEEDDEDDSSDVEYDEHVWLSLENASRVCTAIKDALIKLDPSNSSKYSLNTENYISKLHDLDSKYKDTVNNAKRNTIVFGDRFPFRYLVEDYGMKYYAAFLGCSAESEASFDTVIFLANKVDELQIPVVFTIENPNHTIAETIIKNTKAKSAKVLVLDSMQSTTSKDIKNGVSYLSIMEKNLETLKIALN
jgi:zinc transport system substrate-binding protein